MEKSEIRKKSENLHPCLMVYEYCIKLGQSSLGKKYDNFIEDIQEKELIMHKYIIHLKLFNKICNDLSHIARFIIDCSAFNMPCFCNKAIGLI